MRWIALLVVLSCVPVLAARPAVEHKRARPPTESELVGTWQGYSDSQLEFATLELDPGGVGYLAISYLPDDAPLLYKVEKWTTRNFVIEATVRPVDAAAEAVSLSKIHVGLVSLTMELRGASWKRMLTLFDARSYDVRASAGNTRLQSAKRVQR